MQVITPIKIPKMILIDIDGTMIDSVPDLSWCINQMMQQLELTPCDINSIRLWVGNGIDKLIHRALTNDMDLKADLVLFEKAMNIFQTLYKDNTSKRSRLYPGVRPALEWFQAKKIKLGCVTNKAEKFTLTILQEFSLLDYFPIIVSGDSLPKKKPDPLPLLHICNFFKVSPRDSLMIGDSINDVIAARNANFNIAALTYGYNHGMDIQDSNPDIVLDRMDELITILNPHLTKKIQ